MMIMTAKVDLKKVLVILGTAAALILGLILLLGKSPDAQTTSAAVTGNDERVQFLKSFGWDVTTSPVESSQVRIPDKTSEVFDRYNAMQKQQKHPFHCQTAAPMYGSWKRMRADCDGMPHPRLKWR